MDCGHEDSSQFANVVQKVDLGRQGKREIYFPFKSHAHVH